MSHFTVPEDQAYALARCLEQAEIGNDISDAIWYLTSEGDLEKALTELVSLRKRLDEAITSIRARFSSLEKRDDW
jgi:hypothetical protein